MAFKISRNVAGRVPDCVDHIPAGAAIEADTSVIVNGYLLAIDEATGTLVAATSGAGVAGWSVVEVGGTTFPTDAQGNPQGSSTLTIGDGLLMQPASDTAEVVADITTLETVAGDLKIGSLIDIESPLGLNATASINDDFKVTRIIQTNADGKATKVGGRFQNIEYLG